MHNLRGAFLSFLLVLTAGTPQWAKAENSAFPPRAENSQGSSLPLVGAGTVERNYVPFYSIALYAPPSVRSTEQVLSGLNVCRVHIIWALPQLDQTAMHEYWIKAIQTATGPENFPRVKPQVERLVQSLPAVQRGQNVVFDYVPDAGMKVLVDDKVVVQLAGVEFNRNLLSIWLGPSAPKDVSASLSAGFRKK